MCEITTYKLFRKVGGKLYPLFVERSREMITGVWLFAQVGTKVDDTHVKSSLGALSLRPGFHSTEVPYAGWIGKKKDGKLVQRKNTVWCECAVEGEELTVTAKNGLRELPNGYYKFRTNANQVYPWIISDKLMIKRELSHDEVVALCAKYNLTAQELER